MWISFHLFRVGQNIFLYVQATWKSVGHWIKARESAHVDLVDSGPTYHDQTHVLNSELFIVLVKFDGCDLISQSANCGVTHSCLWTLRWISNGGDEREVELASWNRGPLIACNVAASWPFKHSSAKWTARIFYDELFYKYKFSLTKM